MYYVNCKKKSIVDEHLFGIKTVSFSKKCLELEIKIQEYKNQIHYIFIIFSMHHMFCTYFITSWTKNHEHSIGIMRSNMVAFPYIPICTAWEYEENKRKKSEENKYPT